MNKSLENVIKDIGKSMDIASQAQKELDEAQKELENAGEKVGIDEGVHTGNTAYGAELTRSNIYKDEMYSMVVNEKSLLDLLPGNHGQVNAPSVNVTIKGKPNLFQVGTQSIGSDGTSVTGTSSINTGQVVIPINKLETQIHISRESAQYAVSQGNLVDYVRQQIVDGARETINALIINADTQTNITTGNVNKKTNGANPVALDTTKYFLTQDNGLRKVAIANTITSAAAISKTQYQNILLALGEYADENEQLLWIASPDAGVRARAVDGYETINKFGTNATNIKGGIVERIEGIDVFKTRHLSSSVSSAGYIETGDSAANDYSQLMLLYRPGVQYAFGHDMVIVPIERSGGWTLDVAMWFGFNVVDEVAGLDKVVQTGLINKS